jgi:hypothetical protein
MVDSRVWFSLLHCTDLDHRPDYSTISRTYCAWNCCYQCNTRVDAHPSVIEQRGDRVSREHIPHFTRFAAGEGNMPRLSREAYCPQTTGVSMDWMATYTMSIDSNR